MATSRDQRSGRTWTNLSVLKLAGKGDPVDAITSRARSLVLDALDAGWAGPPFDPLRLLAHLKIDAVARDDILDARTIPLAAGGVCIEFNPNRPSGRVRYSIAHEIAHTLFPDCAQTIRQRARHQDVTEEDWQLEALCNIGAAEILMPYGSVQARMSAGDDIEQLLAMQRDYEVSSEALLIRTVRLSDAPCAMFCASRIASGYGAGRFHLDYLIPSRAWRQSGLAKGMLAPVKSVLAECTAIGHTASAAAESWSERADRVSVQAMAIPPYPGSRFPRVVGTLKPTEPGQLSESCMRFVRGNATEPRGEGARIIVQVVNDKTPNWGGGGFAQAVRSALPQVQDDFKDWVIHQPQSFRLGKVRIVNLTEGVSVASVIAQRSYGDSPSARIRYAALRDGLLTVAAEARRRNATIHMPRIGTGHGGGRWPIIEDIVRTAFCDNGIQVTVYDLPGAQGRPTEAVQTAFQF